jgi:hypothetical protein
MNAKNYVTDNDLMNDLFGCENTTNTSVIKNREYYINQTNQIMDDISNDNYFEVLQIMLVSFNKLDETQQNILMKNIDIKPIKPIKQIKSTKNPINQKKNKIKRLNMDDY